MRTLALVVALVVAGALVPVASARTVLLGRSWQGRTIEAVEVGNRSGTPVLVVGCIHGNETAGIAIARALERMSPHDLDLWVLPDLNPDGVAADRRQNAHGVDLNRNFPWRWRPLSGVYESGPHPLSEPESRLAAKLILRLRPMVTIWFHQPFDVVDESGGSVAVERRYSELTGLPLRRLTRFPGSVASWENHRLPGSTAFVVELPPGRLSAAAVARDARAVLEIAPEEATAAR